MKNQILTTIVAAFISLTTFAQVDRGEQELATLTNTVVEQYDTNKVQISAYKTNSTSSWRTIWHEGMIEYIETENGKVINEQTLSIVSKHENESAVEYVVVGNDGNYTMIFWKDGSMVAYEFADGYMLISSQ